ncbi:MAG: hypothetical protein ACFFCH_02735 [Promethearchaeota archaeon]
MSKVSRKRQPFKLMIMDLLLQLPVPAGIADEVASEILKKSTIETPAETIRTMILDSLRSRDAKAAEVLEQRFVFVQERLEAVQIEPVNPGDEIYDENALDELLESDEITAAELFFMEGREGHAWQRKIDHFDTGSTELSREDYYED